MTVGWQVYYCAVSGAAAGLLAWAAVGAAGAARWPNLWLSVGFLGAGVGGPVVAALAVTRGVVERWGAARTWRTVGRAATLGVVAGVAGLGAGQAAFLVFGGEMAGRVTGWVGLCGLLGLAQAMPDGSRRRYLVGAAAGVAAGAAAGALYEALTRAFLADSDAAQMWASGLGLMAVGAAFAGCVPAAERAAAAAVLVVRSGRNDGLEYLLLDRLVVGSDGGCRVFIPDDPTVAPEHLELAPGAAGVVARNLGHTAVRVGGTAVHPGGAAAVPPGTTLTVGATELRVL